jgi:NAD/NADP transhydrogenase alpha subunit
VRVAVPKETGTEQRVALVPDSVGRLAAAGFAIVSSTTQARLRDSRTASTRPPGAEVVAPATLLTGAQAVVRVAAPTA